MQKPIISTIISLVAIIGLLSPTSFALAQYYPPINSNQGGGSTPYYGDIGSGSYYSGNSYNYGNNGGYYGNYGQSAGVAAFAVKPPLNYPTNPTNPNIPVAYNTAGVANATATSLPSAGLGTLSDTITTQAILAILAVLLTAVVLRKDLQKI